MQTRLTAHSARLCAHWPRMLESMYVTIHKQLGNTDQRTSGRGTACFCRSSVELTKQQHAHED
eukprot:1141515-Pelagomonas_calceolata.AAC.7